MYFVMFITFLVFLIGPIFAGKMILKTTTSLTTDKNGLLYPYFQPIGLNNNDTREAIMTGTGALATSSEAANRMIRLF